MMITTGEARQRICVTAVIRGDGGGGNGNRCVAESCSAWRWRHGPGKPAGPEPVGFCSVTAVPHLPAIGDTVVPEGRRRE